MIFHYGLPPSVNQPRLQPDRTPNLWRFHWFFFIRLKKTIVLHLFMLIFPFDLTTSLLQLFVITFNKRGFCIEKPAGPQRLKEVSSNSR
jgi:hypothetical protein